MHLQSNESDATDVSSIHLIVDSESNQNIIIVFGSLLFFFNNFSLHEMDMYSHSRNLYTTQKKVFICTFTLISHQHQRDNSKIPYTVTSNNNTFKVAKM